jgi:hypothetical protein
MSLENVEIARTHRRPRRLGGADDAPGEAISTTPPPPPALLARQDGGDRGGRRPHCHPGLLSGT